MACTRSNFTLPLTALRVDPFGTTIHKFRESIRTELFRFGLKPFLRRIFQWQAHFITADSSVLSNASKRLDTWPQYILQSMTNQNAHYLQPSLAPLWIVPPGPVTTVTMNRPTSVYFTSMHTRPQKSDQFNVSLWAQKIRRLQNTSSTG